MGEYIERESAVEAAKHAWAKGLEPSQHIEIIPAADVEPLKRGRWLPQIVFGTRVWDCSECKTIGSQTWKRCPVCEAKMIEEVKHEN